MTQRRTLLLGIAVLMAVTGAHLRAGGWTVITLKNVPTHVMLGEGSFIYTVRQHGHTPMNDLSGRLEARKGNVVVQSPARALYSSAGVRSQGAYVVAARFPEPGVWTVDLIAGSGLVGDTLTLTLTVLPPGQSVPTAPAAARGRQLFEGKGCVMCHNLPEFSGRKTVNQLDMSGKHYTAAYVKTFLTNVADQPASIDSFGKMPNLGLSSAEIDALAAFLSQ